VKILDLTLPSPAENLACDEALLDLCENERVEILRFWESRQHFVVVGYGNRIETEVNVEECRRRGVPILRRCSGGGTVVQGPGCLNYSVTLRLDDEETGPLVSVTGANQFVMERNRAALEKLLRTAVDVQGCTDLVFDGKMKFSGNAQRRRRHALVFHGTVLHAFDLSLIDQLLRFPSAQPDYRKSRSHADFVRNIRASGEEIRAALREAWQTNTEFPSVPEERIAHLVRDQYANDEWNLRR
jgi:lipoate-protein ligase A